MAAAEPSQCLSLRQVRAAERLDTLLASWPAERRLIVCDETGGGVPIADALRSFQTEQAAALLIGPEGGFTDRELDALGKLPIVTPDGLGTRVLRADTAAVATWAMYQA